MTTPRRNIELKARLRDLAAARATAEKLATEFVGVQWQIDTYFVCAQGRLKLREIDDRMAQLVAYERSDERTSKASDYYLVAVPQPALLKQALTAALGVRGVVRKRREIFLVENVRIHLDEVDGLGTFLEFEAVLGPHVDDRKGAQQVAELREAFGLRTEDLLACSYSDMCGW
ncbi:MAG: class IV adenylate cyclase [Pirellulales bacterium]|nr:class IV adenylate cyclase [Pirellulales bacterium]